MKYTFVVLFVALCSDVGNKITGHRFPIISGDTVALHAADTSSTKWLECTKASCGWTSCSGAAVNSREWKPCSKQMVFIIKGKEEGRAIVSGDTVSLSSVNYGPGFLLGCSDSKITPCSMKSVNSQLRGNNWLEYSNATFQIFSRDAADGTAVQDGDVIGLKYPYCSNGAWLTFFGGQFYPRFCSPDNKEKCAAEKKTHWVRDLQETCNSLKTSSLDKVLNWQRFKHKL